MTYEQAVAYIHAQKQFTHPPGLEVMRQLMRRLGDPQQGLRFVHVAGTNGKGSVTAMLASILTCAGLKTGMSISPYVVDFRERFQIDGQMIPAPRLVELVERLRPHVEALQAEGLAVNEFELVTALALEWFYEEGCDIVCLEVGLGGRYDATNVIPPPLVSCITRIGLDHTALLGDTVEKIAAEKCGILKPGTVVVSYPQQLPGVDCVIRDGCAALDLPLLVPEVQDIRLLDSNLLQNRVDYGGYEVELPMKGHWQANHMAMAIEAALALWRQGLAIEDEAILQGLAQARLPARMELLSLRPLVLLDGGHNPDGVDALAGMLERSGLPKMHAVIGMMRDKACQEMLRRLSDCFDVVYTVAPQNPRALPAEQLAEMAAPFFDEVYAAPTVPQALEAAMRGVGGKKGLCVCGSLYLAGEARGPLQALLESVQAVQAAQNHRPLVTPCDGDVE